MRMENEDSLFQKSVSIYFVLNDKYESEKECNDKMLVAYNLCIQNEFEPQWIREDKCHAMKAEKSDVFVMEEFEGELFEKLRNYKCSIVGPPCLVSCFLTGDPIPEGTNTVFTTAMRGMVVCASGFPPNVKENIHKKVEYMGGMVMRQLRTCVTHLISDSVWSAKYEKAVEQGIGVLTDKWIDAVWEANQHEFVRADDPAFDIYKCPVFMNLIVTSTNLPKRQKEEVKKMINSHGGTFMGVLDGSKVKVVLAPKKSALSDKLKYAKQNNIACLDVEWVYKSVSAGYALPFTDYLIKSTKATSTPEKSQAAHETLDISTISTISSEFRRSDNLVDETLATTISSKINSCTMAESSSDRQSLAPYAAGLERLDVRQAKLAGPFLDGCNIYLAGFPTNHRDKINRILNAGSATRLDDMSDALTHVLVGDPVKASSELQLMKSKGLSPYILSLDWLEESLKLKRPAPEENYVHDKKLGSSVKPAEPPSPLSKKNIQMLQRVRRPPPPQFDIDKAMQPEKPNDEDEEASLMKEYLQDATIENHAAERSFQDFLQLHNSTASEVITSKKSFNSGKSFSTSRACTEGDISVAPANDSAIPLSQSTIVDKMFEGRTFLVTGFDPEENSIVLQNIQALGGRLVSNSFAGVPDFGVVPLIGAPLKHTVDEIVTDLFIEDCIDQESFVDLKYYHRPLSISATVKPLESCVIATSSYAGIERSYLSKVAMALGARYQDTFARRTNAEKNHVGNTHLLCPSPEGSKYNAAVKWSLPAVTAEWLRACAAKMRLVDETPYLVGETRAPERPEAPAEASHMGPPAAATTPRTILTPKRHLQNGKAQGTPGFVTPLINKRLDLSGTNTPRTSYDIPTPETPYGAIFNPNPSPETRKEWVRWINNFPDFRRDEPPPKRRTPSTPLSELRRQFWRIVTEPFPPKNAEGQPLTDEVFESKDTDGKRSVDEVFESPAPVTARGGAYDPLSASHAGDGPTEDTADAPNAPISRKLSFADDSSPALKKQIDLQIEQLDQVLQATSSTEGRYSLSGNAKIYSEEPIDRIDKCMVKDSQPDTVGWEEPTHLRAALYVPAAAVEQPIAEESRSEEAELQEPAPRKRRFMLSGIKDRTSYETVIRKFGGEVSTEANFDPTATHLLCIRPSRNEKSLASVAAGKWVLHCTYLRDCELEGRFIDEERYEWGNPLSKDVIPEPSGDTEKSIAAAAYRWRLKLQKSAGGAFKDMVAMLLVTVSKYEQFERLIKAGHGTVVQAKPPYDSSPNGKKITHCFIQLNKLEQPVDWAMLASKGILCFSPPYLSEYLTAEAPLNNRDAVIPEFKKYLSLMPK